MSLNWLFTWSLIIIYQLAIFTNSKNTGHVLNNICSMVISVRTFHFSKIIGLE